MIHRPVTRVWFARRLLDALRANGRTYGVNGYNGIRAELSTVRRGKPAFYIGYVHLDTLTREFREAHDRR